MSPPALFLMGPTASGKTGLALALANAVAAGGTPFSGVSLISVDSAQVYRGMDIGTAKLPRDMLLRYPHALIDVLDPAESYSAAQFQQDARALVEQARAERCLPVLVGGTGLYFRALEHGLADLPLADAAVRERLRARALEQGWPALHRELQDLDAEAARLIKPNDPQRIVRALEIHALTGRSRSAHWAASRRGALAGPIVKIGLMPSSRELLHAAIARRFEQMMEAGFLAEVAALKARGDLHARLPALRAVGYRQLWEHLHGEHSLSVAVELGIAATRQYAKRQITWMRSETSLEFVDPGTQNVVANVLAKLAAVPSLAGSD